MHQPGLDDDTDACRAAKYRTYRPPSRAIDGAQKAPPWARVRAQDGGVGIASPVAVMPTDAVPV